MALTFTIKNWALSGWDGSAWRWHNVRTLASTCPSSITRAATIKKQKNASTPATAIWIHCYKSQKGEIHAAGLDVFEQEPLSVDSPLLSMANVVAVPHIGSATHETRYGMAACAVDNLIDALQGKVEKNCVNPHVAD